jgi:hypothetical protein
MEQSSSMSSMDSEACDSPSQELVELETVCHHLVIDVHVKTFESNDECNKSINLSLYVFEHCTVILHSVVYHMCEFMILAHV